MMPLRSLSGLILVLVLAVTSVTMAVARQYDPMGRTMIICAEGGTQTVILDAEGRKVPLSHPCPDCVVGMQALLTAMISVARPVKKAGVLPNLTAVNAANAVVLAPMARGPPAVM